MMKSKKAQTQPVSGYLVIPCNQEDITQLLVLEVGLHLTESLFCMICGLEKLIGRVVVHSGEGAQSQPVEERTDVKIKAKGHVCSILLYLVHLIEITCMFCTFGDFTGSHLSFRTLREVFFK